MASFNLKIEKIAGAESTNNKTAVFSKRLMLGDGTLSNVVACINVGGEGFDLSVLTADIFDLFCKRLEDADGGILEALKIGKDSCREYLAAKEVDAHFAFAIFYKEACYICRFGQKVKIHLYGNEASGEISFGEGSGKLQNGQIFVIATDRFLAKFDTSTLVGAKEADFEELVDGLATDISAESEQAGIGACLVYVKGEIEKVEEEKKEAAAASGQADTAIGNVDRIENPAHEEEKFVPIPKRSTENKTIAFIKVAGREIVKLRNGDIRAVLRLRRNVVLAAAIILIVLFGSVSYTVIQKNKKAQDGKIDAFVASANTKFNEAVSLIGLNRDRARQILVDAENDVASALKIDSKNDAATKLKSQIDAKLKETEAKQNVNFETVGDFGSNVSAVSLNGKNLVVVSSQKVSTVDVSTKKVADAADANGTGGGIFYSGSEYVFDGSNIIKVDLAGGQAKKIAKVDVSAHDIDIFLGNIYLLRNDGITKLIPIEGGYNASDYLSSKTDFGASSKMAIDTSIWVTKGDKILKFTRAQQESFNISGLVSTVSYSFGPIFTSADSDNLYVVDTANGALLVINKKGVFQKVYQAPEFAKAADLTVDEASGAMYLAVGSKILKAPL